MQCHCGNVIDASTSQCASCGTLVIGERGELSSGVVLFEKYEVVRLLGSGGMGKVYLAKDLQLERMVALKTLSQQLAQDEEHKSRFMREARMASALNHPNILTVFEIGAVGETLFMATEYVEGQTLRQLLRSGPISLKEALDIAIQATQGLAAAHEAGIIHRDLKLENFILRSDGYLKILDFGLAKEVNGIEADIPADFKTKVGIILGTPNYMSPEQAKGKELDARSDIFSFGTVLYELLTSKVAFDAETDMQVLFNVAFRQPDPISDQVPLRLREIVKRSMQKVPEARYPTMRAFFEDLSSVRDELHGSGQYAAIGERGSVKSNKLTSVAEKLMPTGLQSRLTIMSERYDSAQLMPALTPDFDSFIGRDLELAILITELQRVNDGKARPVLILGDTGSGKTQILTRFQQLARESGSRVAFTSFFDLSSSLTNPYQTVVNLLSSLFGMRASDSGVGKEGDANNRITSYIKTQFNQELPVAIFERQPNANTEAEKWQILEALRSFFAAITLDQPLAILLDNLHWADDLSLELFGYLLRNLTSSRIFFVATGSEEEATRQGSRLRDWVLAQSRYSTFEQIKLKPFTPADVRLLTEAIFKRVEISARELERLCNVTSGNPYHLVEMLRLLVQNNKITLGEGWWRCESLDEIELPTTVGIAVQYKIERCSDELKEVLTRAAVLGENFKFELLAELADKDEDELEVLLADGIKAHLICEDRGSKGDDFRFHTVTIRRVLYDSLSKRQRRRLHSSAAEAIKTVYKSKLTRFYSSLAYHYNSAGEWSEALDFGIKALNQVLESESWSDVARYARWIEEAFNAINENPDDYGPVDRSAIADIKTKNSVALLRLGNISGAVEQAKSALAISEELGSDKLIARSKARLCELGWYQGRFNESLEIGRSGLINSAKAQDDFSERQLHFHSGVAAWRAYPFSEGLAHLGKACELSERHGDNRILMHARIFYSILLHCQGDWREANQRLTNALEFTRRLGDRFCESRALSVSSVIFYYERRHSEIQEIHKAAITLMRQIGWRIGEAYVHMMLGFDHLSPTNLDIGIAWDYLQRGLAICQETGEKGFMLLAARGLAKVAMLQGDYQQAITKLNELLAMLRHLGELFEQSPTLCYLGEAYELAGQPEQALEFFQASQEMADRLNFPFWQWQALYGQGRCLQALGRPKDARARLSQACAIIIRLRKEFLTEEMAENFVKETQPVSDLLLSLSIS